MPRRDAYHDAVKNPLVKDGWVITHDPFILEFEDVQLFVDLAAEKTIAAEKSGRKIVVEIKVFKSISLFSELEKSLGQYDIYSMFLEETSPERKLYLAVAQEVWENFFQRSSVKFVMSRRQMNLLIFNSTEEEIVEWIN